ncbi:MAG: UDP-4-amino-4-deoxy-L-arabinose-oxoglutarate aminotransferase [Elusimicrobia bacterium GWA2_69_24]|nr:MAG: UDP-4-amino-4-deoxy-L-arabinose-oxoglutarate aminotransferase [Candidatus Rokubacteria bacterium RBG_16_73_20]OGR60920.1 MAG: UDP-4-amino-4-deoxy-L-arabinose-oxoglutarate aminotransferase [Elusimicrobia bacterium GWA2_69_24]HBH00733.1 glycosyltransferase [Candidatus Rokubacteria bacterium]
MISVVIPVFNEARSLADLHHRLAQTLKETGEAYEVVFVDDGSTDGSIEILRALHAQDRTVRVVRLNRNWGQHAAVLAGMERACGDVVVTLDADLQNPPEEIPRLLAALAAGHDVAGGRRVGRRDGVLRRLASWAVNRVTSAVVGVRMRDYGCMLRAYRRSVVERIVACQEAAQFIPALANTFAGSVAEVPVAHDAREHGRSRYGLFRLLRLCFDLLTGFSLLPIQVVSLTGMLVAVLGLAFGLFLGLRRLIVGPEVEGVFTLFAILFFFVGLQILALGLIGEYVGRIYQEVRRRPRYVVSEVLD